MCTHNIIVQAIPPFIFLKYLAVSGGKKLVGAVVVAVVGVAVAAKGVARA